MRRWGLALGGGGLYGFAHIGVLQVFEERGIVPHVVAGTSAGALVAGLWLSGLGAEAIEKETMRTLLSEDTLGLLPLVVEPSSLGMEGLVGANLLEAAIDRLVSGANLSDIRVPLAITSVDVITGQLVVFTNCAPRGRRHEMPNTWGGRVYVTDAAVSAAIRASISMPGVFAPKRFGQWSLIDGGIKDMVPVFEVARMGAREVVGVDLGLHVDRPMKPTNLISILARSVSISARETTERYLGKYATLTLQPDVASASGIPMPACAKELIRLGRVCAEKALPRITTLIL